MQYAATIASLLVITWSSYRLGFNRGYLDGYEKGANTILDEWRTWLNDFEEE